jgi:hypothetical protein
VRCDACDLEYHADCWGENGGCATYGCQGRARPDRALHRTVAAERAHSAAPARESSTRSHTFVWISVAAVVVIAIVAAAVMSQLRGQGGEETTTTAAVAVAASENTTQIMPTTTVSQAAIATTTSAPPTTTTTLPPGPLLLFSDDFQSLANFAAEPADTYDVWGVNTLQHQLEIDVRKSNWLWWTWSGYSDIADCSAELDGAVLTPGKGGYYGIVVRASDPLDDRGNRHLYAFLVSNQGRWKLWRFVGGDSSSNIDSRYTKSGWSDAIQTGTAWNHLKITVVGMDMYLYINGIQVWRESDLRLASGYVGYIAWSDAWSRVRFGFDNLKIWSEP